MYCSASVLDCCSSKLAYSSNEKGCIYKTSSFSVLLGYRQSREKELIRGNMAEQIIPQIPSFSSNIFWSTSRTDKPAASIS